MDVGPLVNAAAADKVERYVDIGRREGELVIGGAARDGRRPRPRPLLRSPTIFHGVAPMATIAQEEIFGPVLSVIPVDGYDEAMTAANQVKFGLSASSTPATSTRPSGRCATSRPGSSTSTPGTTGAETHLPFGGWKDTGNGHREAGHVALDTFTEWKAIYVDF